MSRTHLGTSSWAHSSSSPTSLPAKLTCAWRMPGASCAAWSTSVRSWRRANISSLKTLIRQEGSFAVSKSFTIRINKITNTSFSILFVFYPFILFLFIQLTKSKKRLILFLLFSFYLYIYIYIYIYIYKKPCYVYCIRLTETCDGTCISLLFFFLIASIRCFHQKFRI